MKIYHQLQHLFPNWEIKHLFIGTFNPEGGDSVSYFYGREKNFFWKVLSDIFSENFDPKSSNFNDLLVKQKIACVDMIKSVQRNDKQEFSEKQLMEITRKGYSDSKIINGSIKREYNTLKILRIIETNNSNVYSTWGNGSNLKDWKNEISKIPFTANLISPSPVARVPKGESKYDYVIQDWKRKIKI